MQPAKPIRIARTLLTVSSVERFATTKGESVHKLPLRVNIKEEPAIHRNVGIAVCGLEGVVS